MTRGAVSRFGPMLSMMNQMGGGVGFSSDVSQSSYGNPKTSDYSNSMESTIIKTYVVEQDLTTAQQRQSRLKDLSTFQTSVGACMEEQTDPANQAKVEEFYKYLDKMSETLLVMAADGLRSTRRQRQGMGGDEGVEMAPQEAPAVEDAPIMGGDRSVSRVLSPIAPTMGR